MLCVKELFILLEIIKVNSPFMVIHFDVCGPSRIPTTSGDMWFVTSVIAILR